MGEKCLPYTKLHLVHEVDDKHSRQIEAYTKFLDECVLGCTEEYDVSWIIDQHRKRSELTNVGTDEVGFSSRST